MQATSASRLFSKNVPEKIIQEKTGHRTLSALRAYERTSTTQQQIVTKLLSSDNEMFEDVFRSDSTVETKDLKLESAPLEEEKKQVVKPEASAPIFAGKLENCTLNFYA